jgi:hypothetical protein
MAQIWGIDIQVSLSIWKVVLKAQLRGFCADPE